MSATRPVGELRAHAGKLISQQLNQVTVAEAARALNVSRQAIYGFKSGKFCPSLAVIERACVAWGLEFSIRGMTVSERSFKPKSRPPKRPAMAQAQQLTMFDLWNQLENQRMTVVSARQVDGAVEMTLRISVPA